MNYYLKNRERIVNELVGQFPITASAWELYSDHQGSTRAARELHEHLLVITNIMVSSWIVHVADIAKELEKYSDLGAMDTEPRANMKWALRKIVAKMDEIAEAL